MISFEVKLIRVAPMDALTGWDVFTLMGNALHVGGNYWIFEGDEESLELSCPVEVVAEGVTVGTADLYDEELRAHCEEIFCVDLSDAELGWKMRKNIRSAHEAATAPEQEYSYSVGEAPYCGSFSSPEEAIEEALAGAVEGGTFLLGENEPPPQPEQYWDAEDWLEQVSCSDDYRGEWAEGWDESTLEQREQLERTVRTVLSEWLDRNALRPRFFSVRKFREYEVVDGKAVAVA